MVTTAEDSPDLVPVDKDSTASYPLDDQDGEYVLERSEVRDDSFELRAESESGAKLHAPLIKGPPYQVLGHVAAPFVPNYSRGMPEGVAIMKGRPYFCRCPQEANPKEVFKIPFHIPPKRGPSLGVALMKVCPYHVHGRATDPSVADFDKPIAEGATMMKWSPYQVHD